MMMIAEPTWREVSDLIAASPGSIESRLPDRIRQLRESHRAPDGSPDPLTHTDLARRLGETGWSTDRTTVWKIENPSAGNGRRKITIDELVALSQALGVTVAELLLPDGALRQMETRNALVAAIDALDDVNQAWARYASAVTHARGLLLAATDADVLRTQFQSWADDLRAVYVKRTVQLWLAWMARRVERGERPPDANLITGGSDEEIMASESFARFRSSLSEQPLYPAYLDVLGDELLAYPRPMEVPGGH